MMINEQNATEQIDVLTVKTLNAFFSNRVNIDEHLTSSIAT